MFDPYGHVTARLALDDIGVLDVKLPQSLPPTLYSRVGDIPFFAALLFIAGALLWRRLREPASAHKA
jgi:apolipoprotein N-acyltransferase